MTPSTFESILNSCLLLLVLRAYINNGCAMQPLICGSKWPELRTSLIHSQWYMLWWTVGRYFICSATRRCDICLVCWL